MSSSNAILAIKALDGLAARAAVTATNLANAGTPDYRPQRVTFEDALRHAATAGDAAVQTVAPQTERVPMDGLPGGGELRLDLEMQTASTTALRYGALISMLGRDLELNALAVTGNG